jgi:hypothetical protein
MNDTATMILRIAFLVILIWILAALTGMSARASVSSSGFRARIGKGGGCRRGRGRHPRWMWGSNGMVGELIPTTGAQPQLAGLNTF